MLELVIDGVARDIGALGVRRVLPYAQHRMVGPFIFLDHLGPLALPRGIPRALDVRPHPHIGLATVTYLFEGELMHRDSVGSQQPVRVGEVNWMTAGRGITHSERFEKARAEGGAIHGIQCWVALPTGEEECAPSFVHWSAAQLPLCESPGESVRVLAGAVAGAVSPVATRSPLFLAHWTLAEGAHVSLPERYPERAAFIVSGSVEVEGRTYGSGQLLVFAAGGRALIRTLAPSIVIALGGEPVGPRYIEWNFVSSSQERIEQAKVDWRAGRMKLPDFDDREFIALPGP